MEQPLKFCKDCKHLDETTNQFWPVCKAPQLQPFILDLVTGKQEIKMNAASARVHPCGREAKFFEPKDTPNGYSESDFQQTGS